MPSQDLRYVGAMILNTAFLSNAFQANEDDDDDLRASKAAATEQLKAEWARYCSIDHPQVNSVDDIAKFWKAWYLTCIKCKC